MSFFSERYPIVPLFVQFRMIEPTTIGPNIVITVLIYIFNHFFLCSHYVLNKNHEVYDEIENWYHILSFHLIILNIAKVIFFLLKKVLIKLYLEISVLFPIFFFARHVHNDILKKRKKNFNYLKVLTYFLMHFFI